LHVARNVFVVVITLIVVISLVVEISLIVVITLVVDINLWKYGGKSTENRRYSADMRL